MPRNSKVSAEEKLRIVEDCLNGKMGVRKAGRLVGVDHSVVRAWISRYCAEGPSAFLATERNRAYSAELKRKAIKDYLSGGGSLLDLCKKYQIRSTRQLINSWTGSRCIIVMEILKHITEGGLLAGFCYVRNIARNLASDVHAGLYPTC